MAQPTKPPNVWSTVHKCCLTRMAASQGGQLNPYQKTWKPEMAL